MKKILADKTKSLLLRGPRKGSEEALFGDLLLYNKKNSIQPSVGLLVGSASAAAAVFWLSYAL
jgi:hypothetical protein